MRFSHRITVIHPPLVEGTLPDELVKDWPNATRKEYFAEVQQESSTEFLDGREARVTITRLWMRPCHAVHAIDRVEWNGVTFEVSGDPDVRYDGASRPDHVEVKLRVVPG